MKRLSLVGIALLLSGCGDIFVIQGDVAAGTTVSRTGTTARTVLESRRSTWTTLRRCPEPGVAAVAAGAASLQGARGSFVAMR
jgi:enoyl-CoA hydratase/carnithine racemase